MSEQIVSSASTAHVAANRLNARKSTGPRTPRGKAIAAGNALKHGLFATSLLLRGEDEAELTQLKVELVRRLNPRDPMELILVERVIASAWKLRRLERFEASLFARESDAWDDKLENDREAHGLGRREPVPAEVAWQTSTPEFRSHLDRLATQQQRLESGMRRSLRQLAILQKQEIDQPVTEFAAQTAALEQSAAQNRQNEATAIAQLNRQASIADIQQARQERQADRRRSKKLKNEAKRRKRRERDPERQERHYSSIPTIEMHEALERQKLQNEPKSAQVLTPSPFTRVEGGGEGSELEPDASTSSKTFNDNPPSTALNAMTNLPPHIPCHWPRPQAKLAGDSPNERAA